MSPRSPPPPRPPPLQKQQPKHRQKQRQQDQHDSPPNSLYQVTPTTHPTPSLGPKTTLPPPPLALESLARSTTAFVRANRLSDATRLRTQLIALCSDDTNEATRIMETQFPSQDLGATEAECLALAEREFTYAILRLETALMERLDISTNNSRQKALCGLRKERVIYTQKYSKRVNPGRVCI